MEVCYANRQITRARDVNDTFVHTSSMHLVLVNHRADRRITSHTHCHRTSHHTTLNTHSATHRNEDGSTASPLQIKLSCWNSSRRLGSHTLQTTAIFIVYYRSKESNNICTSLSSRTCPPRRPHYQNPTRWWWNILFQQ